MKKICLLFVCLLLVLLDTKNVSAQVANAGADRQIYLSKTSTVLLIGSKSSGTKFKWTDISTDYKCPGKILSPTQKTTKVTGLQQGVFYFQLAVSKGNKITRDTTVITVDYAPPPSNARLVRKLEISNPVIYNFINNRHNTSQLSGSPESVSTAGGDNFFDRARSNSMYIGREHKKFYSTVEDGYHWQSDDDYARTEVHWGSYWNFDSSKEYIIEWKGYFPQDFNFLKENQTVVSPFQIHGQDDDSPPFSFSLLNGHDGGNAHVGKSGLKALYFCDSYAGNNSNKRQSTFHYIIALDSMVNQTHTIRLTLLEGETGFVKVQIDGATRYFRNRGKIGATLNKDYPKFASIYDYDKALVDPAKRSRGRKFSLVTESFRIYELTSENK